MAKYSKILGALTPPTPGSISPIDNLNIYTKKIRFSNDDTKGGVGGVRYIVKYL